LAKEAGDREIIRMLLEHGADPNEMPHFTLHWYIFSPLNYMTFSGEPNDLELCKLLMVYGIRVDQMDVNAMREGVRLSDFEQGKNALIEAAKHADAPLVRLLIEGVPLKPHLMEPKIAEFETMARADNCYIKRLPPEIRKKAAVMIFKNSANPNVVDQHGRTALDIAEARLAGMCSQGYWDPQRYTFTLNALKTIIEILKPITIKQNIKPAQLE